MLKFLLAGISLSGAFLAVGYVFSMLSLMIAGAGCLFVTGLLVTD